MSSFEYRGPRRRERVKKVFEKIMAENFLNLKKETDIQVQEAWRIPIKMNAKRLTPDHIIIKMAKVREV